MAEARNGSLKPPDGAAAKSSGGGGGYEINVETFVKRVKALYDHWKEHKQEFWGNSNAITVAAPPPSEDLRYLKSSALNIWLLGYEFPETLMLFMANRIHFLCSQKKASLLEVLKKPAKSSLGIDIVIHVKARNDSGAAQMEKMCEDVRAECRSGVPVVGWIAKEAPEGQLIEAWAEKLKGSGFQLVDVGAGFSEIFAVKDEMEITNIKKAAFLSASVLKNVVVPRLEVTIDEEKKVAHSDLMDDTEKAILDPQKAKVKLRAENVDICYSPVFQSGGEFDLRPGAVSNDENLYYEATGVIICAIGSRYNSYCSNVARTYLIDAENVQGKAYRVLLKAHEAAISALRPGNPLSAAYKAAVEVVQREGSEFSSHLTKSAGTGIGIEFRESGLSLNARNDKIVKAGMAFNVSLGFQNLQLQSENPKTKNYSLLIADTVVVRDKGPENATAVSSKVYNDVAYSFNDEEEEEKPKAKVEANRGENVYSKATLRSENQETKEEQRRQHQAELARQKNEETARRLASGGVGIGDGHGSNKPAGEMIAYKNVDDIPTSRELMIQVDTKNDAVLVPIYGIMVPFHVATIKSVTSQQDGGNSYIRIIFNVPGTGFNSNYMPTTKFPNSIYVKEISFRSKDSRHINQVVQMIKTHRRSVAMKESEKAERATLVTQEKLQLSKTKPIRLADLWIRPAFGGRGRKMTGTLEAHYNGFRYSTMRSDERVDIMYQNMKHAFFQPADKEMITLLHFHLHNHIMVGNKKTKDVQFYVEVMDVVQTLGGARRSMYDPDEIEEEQQERDRKNKINTEFEGFVKRVTELWEQPHLKAFELEFDIPFRELGFHGVPFKASAFIVPTVNCLVELIETPFLVVTISEIEIVNLERVGLGQKAFDMAIVFKDFKRDVLRIDAIPSSSLDGIKEWLNSLDIKYYESRMNLNWRPILKTITDDPDKFIEDGGWEFLNMEVSDSDSGNSEESDQGYEPSDMEEESESEDEDSENESLVESEEEEEEEEDSEEEEGKTWDELEAEARNADKEKGDESDSEEERQRRKAKAAGKSRRPDIRDPRGMPSKRPKVRR
uniref:FACT complex subunit n=1 Tax=Araucaria cunninghamii TaxID=56994 RepID=A0A0D6QWA7_ARACU